MGNHLFYPGDITPGYSLGTALRQRIEDKVRTEKVIKKQKLKK